MSTRPADHKRSYGYARFQILAAFVNGLSLFAIVAWILFEAVQRLITPTEVIGQTMLLVATLGLFVNIASFALLHGGDQQNLNMRGAALHVASDLLGSVAAIIAALVILSTGWTPIDPLLSLVVAMLIVRSAWHLVRRSAHILLEGAPEGLDTAEIRERLIDDIPAVCDIHHVHIWGLTTEHRMLTMHVAIDDESADATAIAKRVKSILRDEFAIEHSTVELEWDQCADHPE